MTVKKKDPIETAIEGNYISAIMDRKKDLESKLIQVQREEYAIMAVIGELNVLLDPTLLDPKEGEEDEKEKTKD